MKRRGPAKKDGALRRDPEHKKARVRAWRENNPEKWGEQKKRNYASRVERYRADPAQYLWRTARARAKQTGVPFEIAVEDVVIPTTCPVLGVSIDVLNSSYYNGASLDRVINSLGYVKGNVRVISRKANRLKGDATIEELERLLLYMKGEI